jgi:hypothetical protein
MGERDIYIYSTRWMKGELSKPGRDGSGQQIPDKPIRGW